MTYDEFEGVLSQIKGCTFASIDAVTSPSRGIKKVVTGQTVMVFTNKKSSGYENMVRRRLVKEGKNPSNFVVSDLPFGTRVVGTPLIAYKGEMYLQCIVMREGETKAFIGTREVTLDILGEDRGSNQGLKDSVEVRAYKLSSITAIRILGEELPKPPILFVV